MCTSITLSIGVARAVSFQTSRVSISLDTTEPWCRKRYSSSSYSRTVSSIGMPPRDTEWPPPSRTRSPRLIFSGFSGTPLREERASWQVARETRTALQDSRPPRYQAPGRDRRRNRALSEATLVFECHPVEACPGFRGRFCRQHHIQYCEIETFRMDEIESLLARLCDETV